MTSREGLLLFLLANFIITSSSGGTFLFQWRLVGDLGLGAMGGGVDEAVGLRDSDLFRFNFKDDVLSSLDDGSSVSAGVRIPWKDYLNSFIGFKNFFLEQQDNITLHRQKKRNGKQRNSFLLKSRYQPNTMTN